MRLDYHRDRKKVTKHHFIRGTKQCVEGENEVKIENSAGVPFRKIEIKGNTVTEIKNQALEYSSYLSAIESYTTGGVSGTYAIKLPDGWQGKELTYKLEENTPLSGVDLYLASGSAFLFSDTLPLIENGIVSEQKAKNYTHLIFKGIFDEEIENENGDILSVPTDITRFWQGHSLIVTSDVCPDFPVSFKNANANNVIISAHSENLLELKDGSGSKIDDDGNILSWEIKDGIVTVNGKSNAFTTIMLSYKEVVPHRYKAGVYTYTPYYYREEGQKISSCDWNFGEFAFSGTNGLGSKAFDGEFGFSYCALYISADYEYKDYKYSPALLKGEYKTLDDLPQYKKTFYQEIIMPENVDIDTGEGTAKRVDLNMASISMTDEHGTYTATDYLTLERANGEDKVLYHQNVDKKTVTSDMNMTTYVTNGLRVFILRDTNAKRLNNPILANKYLGYRTVGFLKNKDYGITTDAVYWGVSSSRITIRDTRFETLADFKADLDQNPLVIEYGLAEEITHDITNTDFGKALLNLFIQKGENGYLCLKSEPNATSLVCEYYSSQDQSRVTLLVSYKDKNGTKIKEDKSYPVRRGAYYQISVPHIDGYTGEMQEVFGKADADTTIDLIYTEE